MANTVIGLYPIVLLFKCSINIIMLKSQISAERFHETGIRLIRNTATRCSTEVSSCK